jgi:O-antigen ligase
MIDDRLNRKFYLAALSATGFFLPLSVWLLTFFIVVIVVIWLADGGIKKLPQLIHEKRDILIFCIFFLVYLIWMINTSDILFGLRELKIKLPLLIFPVVIGLSEPLSQRELKIIVSFFIAGVTISSVAGVILRIDPVFSGSSDTREISVFISHIRLALMSVFAIFCSGWYFFSFSELKKSWHCLYLAAALWLTAFLFILISLTGVLVFAFVMTLTVVWITFSRKPTFVKFSLVTILVVLFVSSAICIIHEIKSFYKNGDAYPFPYEQYTANGNSYQHYTERRDVENGNKVWLYINEDELKKEWDSRSTLAFDSLDRKGQKLRFTLIRYLTSAGLKKDSLGVSCLTTKDITNIEKGITNILFTERKPIRSKIYEIIWQIDYYRNGGNPSGHSVTQRIEFFKTGWNIFLRTPLFGTGTGDINKEFDHQYKLDKTILDPNYRYQAHNQYLTFLISFGITGFILICVSLVFPVIMAKGLKSYIPVIFFVIIFLSMLGEDTLETHTGVSFFAYFYSIYIFGKKEEES